MYQICQAAESMDHALMLEIILVSLSNAYQRPGALRGMPIQNEASAARKATNKEGRGLRFCHN
jgi:hypothetical protein